MADGKWQMANGRWQMADGNGQILICHQFSSNNHVFIMYRWTKGVRGGRAPCRITDIGGIEDEDEKEDGDEKKADGEALLKLIVEPGEDAGELGFVKVEGAFGPDDKIGGGHFFLDGPLRADALFDLVRKPAAGEEALALGMGGTGHTDGGIQFLLGVVLEKQRDDNDGERLALSGPGAHPDTPELADGRVQNGFELAAGLGVGEHTPGQHVAAQTAIRTHHTGPKKALDLGQGRLAGFNDLAGEIVRVDNGDAARAKELGGSRFAHADTAG